MNFMLVGAGGAGGKGGTSDESGAVGGSGGGGGTGGVVLINNYYSAVSPTMHNVYLYPIGSSYNSEMILDVGAGDHTFYAYRGGGGGNGSPVGYQGNPFESGYGTDYNGDSANGGSGGTGLVVNPPQNSLPIYCPIIRGGAGGNGAVPSNSTKTGPGASYNGSVIPTGSDQIGNDPTAYVPVTFADGLTTAALLYGGKGGVYGGYNGANSNSSFLMIYFCH